MKKLLLMLVMIAPAFAQQIAPRQIIPGNNGQSLQTVGGVATWANGSGGGGGPFLMSAAVCDGSTDDTAALQSTLTSIFTTQQTGHTPYANGPVMTVAQTGKNCMFTTLNWPMGVQATSVALQQLPNLGACNPGLKFYNAGLGS